jgi:tetratricopeptide (TPR) repeat protein
MHVGGPFLEPTVRLQKGAAYVHTGRVYQILGERDKAQEAFLQAVAVFDRLARDFPDDPTFLHELATGLSIVAEDLYQAGRLPNANVYASQAVSVWRETIRKHPADVEVHLKLAAMLCCWFDPQLRDPKAAVVPARRAVELAPDDPNSWMALGLAYYRTDQWEASQGALQKALQVPEVPRKWEWTHALFALAMARWRCGRQEQAMQAYQRAVWRMENSFRPRNSLDRPRQEDATELGIRLHNISSFAFRRAIQAEAEIVLGIADAPKPKAKEGSPGKD